MDDLRRRGALRFAAGCLALCLVATAGAARAENPLEREVKAAYLYKFGSFVEWPESSFARPDSPLEIAVAGDDALADQLARTVGGRQVGGRQIAVRKLRSGEAPGAAHILFVSGHDRAAAAEMLKSVRGQPVLTVSDTEESLALGCMVAFVVSANKMRFLVALGQVAPSRLRISARMLAAALRVQPGVS
ncbi:YfiR family protein [Massilia cavernae]|uniref:YfiR family protein n=1 Tax=Massilia cavernae TaxID=2320864 RepID=A0A418XRV4_9BURK|nr:YfiR family protein [Massilia cavernae]RJG15269.1 YfiR family protein [Massilia cavernae]